MKRKLVSTEVCLADVTIPIGEVENIGHATRFFQLRLSPQQAIVARRISDGALRAQMTLKSGRAVDTPGRAIQFLLEQVGVNADKA